MKGTQEARARIERIERLLAGSVICDRCGATLEQFATRCGAELTDLCPGFVAIDEAGRP
jgi:hypothetical protein